MIITIPFKTPSVNHLYWHRLNYKIMTSTARKLKDEIYEIVQKQKTKENLKDKILEIRINIHEDWFYKKKRTVARKDVSNREKFMTDAVLGALDIDDKFIFKSTMTKVQDMKCEFTVFEILEFQALP